VDRAGLPVISAKTAGNPAGCSRQSAKNVTEEENQMATAKVIDLAQVQNNPLLPNYMDSDLSQTVSALVLMQTYSSQMLWQPDIASNLGPDLDILLGLGQHQTAAKRHAQYFMQKLQPAVVAGLTDIAGYGSMFKAFRQPITSLLPRLTEGDDARGQIIALLTQLELEAARREDAARDLVGNLRDLNSQIQADSTNFKADVEEANSKIGSDKGALAKAQQDISDTQQRIRGEIGGLVVSSLAIVTGAIVIGVGVLATLPAGVTSTSVILTGVGMVVTGSGALAAAAATLASDNQKLVGLYQQVAKLNTTLTVVHSLADQITPLSETTDHMVDVNGALSTEWSNILTGIGQFKQDVLRATDASGVAYLESALTLAGRKWDALADQAQQMMVRLVDLTPKQVDDVLDFSKQKAA
jgi:hypothetical protein